MKPLSPSESDPRNIGKAVNQLIRGRGNNFGSVSLASGADSTTVSNPVIWSGCKVFLFPTNANAAAELAAGGCYVSSKADGSFVIAHANNSNTRTFDWMIGGG